MNKDKELVVIYEDKDIIVLNKPSGISTHPAAGEKEVSLSELVADYLGRPSTDGLEFVVHRLDKGTSGVILFAKTSQAAENLKQQFANREVHKTYLTLVSGKLAEETGRIDIPLGRNTENRKRIDPVSSGREAVTDFNVLRFYPAFTYVEVHPQTGRTHQIRTHFSAIGHPLAGDLRYGYNGQAFPRIFLHAKRIEFAYPSSGKKVVFEAELPDVLRSILATLD